VTNGLPDGRGIIMAIRCFEGPTPNQDLKEAPAARYHRISFSGSIATETSAGVSVSLSTRRVRPRAVTKWGVCRPGFRPRTGGVQASRGCARGCRPHTAPKPRRGARLSTLESPAAGVANQPQVMPARPWPEPHIRPPASMPPDGYTLAGGVFEASVPAAGAHSPPAGFGLPRRWLAVNFHRWRAPEGLGTAVAWLVPRKASGWLLGGTGYRTPSRGSITQTTHPSVTPPTAIPPHRSLGWDRPTRDPRSLTNPDHPFHASRPLKYHPTARSPVPIHMAGVDYPSRAQRVAPAHTPPSAPFNARIRPRTTYEEPTPIRPVSGLYPSAARWEREARDMPGAHPPNHPDSRRAPTDHGSEGHPSRKDLPPSGHVHVRYEDPDGRTAAAPIETTQEYRHPELASPWEMAGG
jgi:NADH:ubiquinone oxidoreductase subunit C